MIEELSYFELNMTIEGEIRNEKKKYIIIH